MDSLSDTSVASDWDGLTLVDAWSLSCGKASKPSGSGGAWIWDGEGNAMLFGSKTLGRVSLYAKMMIIEIMSYATVSTL